MQIHGTSAFLISKPLQLVISLMVVNQLLFERKPVFIITNSFRGAEGVAERLEQIYNTLLDVRYFDTASEAYYSLGTSEFDHVFIDSDVGLQKAFTLAILKFRSRRTHLYVFEEGVGTYRNDLYQGLKAYIFPALGIATHFGSSPMIEKIFVLNPIEYQNRFPKSADKVVCVSSDVGSFLSEKRLEINIVFGFEGISHPEGSRKALCQIYLSNWHIDQAKLSSLKQIPGDVYFKPHPHITQEIALDGIICLDAGVPAELIIMTLAEIYDKVQVFDHGTSARQYIASPKVDFKCADELIR